MQQPIRDGVHVVDEAADGIAARRGIKEADRQMVELIEQLAAHLVDAVVGNIVAQVGEEPAKQTAEYVNHRQDQ
ncbi:hypothetical protein SDC9_135295 [bioreactor metagenome]|uniref:Uncharacterized protein n=1 Tax=bioreactor metagenome TaxID=1076179 RepID=A0A645DFF8_9ZZZZ